jgi:UDP-glucose 4-epimerase
MLTYEKLQPIFCESPEATLVIGIMNYVGINLLKAFLKLDQKVVGLDSISTANQRSLDEVYHY